MNSLGGHKDSNGDGFGVGRMPGRHEQKGKGQKRKEATGRVRDKGVG